MTVISVVATLVYYALLIFWLFMWARLVLDLARLFARQWRPQGVGMVVASAVFAVTDPPIKLVRRFVRPVRIGNVALDLAFSIVFFIVIVLMWIVGGFR